MDLTEPIKLIQGLEARGANFIIQSAGSPSITVGLTQVDEHAHIMLTYISIGQKNSERR